MPKTSGFDLAGSYFPLVTKTAYYWLNIVYVYSVGLHSKGKFHAKMGSIKDRNGMDLTEAEDIRKRWQEYTEELYKNI